MGEHDQASEAAQAPEELAVAREEAAGLDVGGAGPALALAGARLAARAGAAAGAGLPPGRGAGGVVLARRMLALQRASGNAAAARLLARQPAPGATVKPAAPADAEYRPLDNQQVIPPRGSPEDVAGWLVVRVKPKAGVDMIVVAEGGWLHVFGAQALPAETNRLKASAEHRLLPGVFSMPKLGPLSRLYVFGDPPTDFSPPSLTGLSPKDLVHEVDQRTFLQLAPEPPGEIWIAVPPAPDEAPEGPPGPPPTWAPDLTRRADAELAKEDKTRRPELVPWQRKDGRWFVNVWRHGDHRPLELRPDESLEDLLERIRQAGRDLDADADPARSVRVQGTRAGDPAFEEGRAAGELTIPAGAPLDPTGGLKPNSPPFPARIVSHGPEGLAGADDHESTVTGATVAFTMDLAFAAVTSGFWEEFGARWQVIAYRWEIFDVSKLRLDQIKGALGRPGADIRADIARLRKRLETDEAGGDREQAKAELDRLEEEVAKRGREADSGVTRDMARDVAATWEDTKADLSSVGSWVSGYFVLVGISDVVQLVGAPLSAGFTLAASPMSDRRVGFHRPGLFLLRCFAQPVVTPEDLKRIQARGEQPVIRPPSVAYLPVKVTDINVRATEANDAELAAIADLRRQLDAPPPPFTRKDVEERLKEAEAALEDNTVGAINRAIDHAKAQLKLVEQWRGAEHAGIDIPQRDPELRRWKAMLDLSGTGFADYEQRMHDDIGRLEKARERVQGYGLAGVADRVFRPRLTLVSEVDGRVYPIVGHLAEVRTAGKDKTWRLVDASSDETKDTYEGTGATHNEAINAALERFAAKCDYGRGTIAIRLPLAQLNAYTGETIAVPARLRAAPGFGKRFLTRLSDLAKAAEVAALFVGGPVGVAIGVAGGLAGAAVAVHSLVRRAERGQSLLTFEAGMDVLAVVGAVAMMGGAAAQLKHVAALSSRAKWVTGGLHVFGTGMLYSQVVFIPTATYLQLREVQLQEDNELKAAAAQGSTDHVDRVRYQARRLEILAGALKSGVVTVRMLQLAENPEAGWNPLKGKAPATTPAVDPDAPMRPLNALRHRLREIAGLLNKRGASNAERQQVIQALRTPHASPRGALEGFVHKQVLAENQQAIRKVREALKASEPDVIVGMERGGAFLADALAAGDSAIGAKVRKMRVHKSEPRPDGKPAKTKWDFARQGAEFDALLQPGKPTKVAIVDYYFGGRTASELSELLIKRYAGKPGFEGVTFEVHWIRETFGFSDAAGELPSGRSDPKPGQKGHGMFRQPPPQRVRLALGDDMTIITTSSEQPINVFDDDGTVTQTIRPRGGATSRDALIELLNRPPE